MDVPEDGTDRPECHLPEDGCFGDGGKTKHPSDRGTKEDGDRGRRFMRGEPDFVGTSPRVGVYLCPDREGAANGPKEGQSHGGRAPPTDGGTIPECDPAPKFFGGFGGLY